MEIPAALAADLAALTHALHNRDDDPAPDLDLQQLLHEFAFDIKLAVRSYLGMSLDIATGADTHFCMAALERSVQPGDAGTSLRLPLAAVSDPATLGALTIYASTPGAFVDLAADLGWSLQIDPAVFILDAHLTVPDAGSDTGLGVISIINQAIGALIGGGFSPAAAGRELHQRAMRTGASRHDTATQLLADLHRPPPIAVP